MSTDASTATGGTSQTPQADQRQGIGSTQAQINDLAGGLSNANVNGTVGPNFFVARLNDEATTLALYGRMKEVGFGQGTQPHHMANYGPMGGEI